MRAAAVVIVASLVACGVPAPSETPSATPEPTPEQLTITGTFTLVDSGGIRLARAGTGARVTRCEGSGGYSDIKMGLGVVVRDEGGQTIGSSQLTHDGLDEVGDDDFCALSFAVDVSPAAFYSIEVGNRGELTYSHDDLETADWVVTATLGDG